jgi:hypothetical protein
MLEDVLLVMLKNDCYQSVQMIVVIVEVHEFESFPCLIYVPYTFQVVCFERIDHMDDVHHIVSYDYTKCQCIHVSYKIGAVSNLPVT